MTTKTITIPSEADLHAFFKSLLNTVPRYRMEGTYTVGDTTHELNEAFETKEDVFHHYQAEIYTEVSEHTYDAMCADPEVKEACVEDWNDCLFDDDDKPWNDLDEDEQEEAFEDFVIENYCDVNCIDEDIDVHMYDYHKVLEECMDWWDAEDDEAMDDNSGCEYLSDGLIKYNDGTVGVMMSSPKLTIVDECLDDDHLYGRNHKYELEVAFVCDVLIDGHIITHRFWSKDFTDIQLTSEDYQKLNWHSCAH